MLHKHDQWVILFLNTAAQLWARTIGGSKLKPLRKEYRCQPLCCRLCFLTYSWEIQNMCRVRSLSLYGWVLGESNWCWSMITREIKLVDLSTWGSYWQVARLAQFVSGAWTWVSLAAICFICWSRSSKHSCFAKSCWKWALHHCTPTLWPGLCTLHCTQSTALGSLHSMHCICCKMYTVNCTLSTVHCKL